MKEILLSIIVPVYNAGKYLRQCIDSILSSTFKDFELIIVNDGSTDDSAYIIEDIASNENTLTCKGGIISLTQVNSGVSAARNYGIRNAKGKWITFVDADDMVEADYFENLIKCVKLYPTIQMVQGGCTNYVLGHKDTIEQAYNLKFSDSPEYILNNIRGLTFSKLFLRSVIKENRLWFDEKMTLAEDLAFTLDYISFIESIVFSEETGYLYRRHNESLTHSKVIKPYQQQLNIFIHLYNSVNRYSDKHNLSLENREKRYRHISPFLFNVINSMYHNSLPRTERLKRLRGDFKQSHYELLKYNFLRSKVRSVLSLPLVLGIPTLFDSIMSLTHKALSTISK